MYVSSYVIWNGTYHISYSWGYHSNITSTAALDVYIFNGFKIFRWQFQPCNNDKKASQFLTLKITNITDAYWGHFYISRYLHKNKTIKLIVQ